MYILHLYVWNAHVHVYQVALSVALYICGMERNSSHKGEGQCSKPIETAIKLNEHQIYWVYLSCLNHRIVRCIFYGKLINISAHLQLQKRRSPPETKVMQVFFFRRLLNLNYSCNFYLILFSLLQPSVLSIKTLLVFL